MDRAYRHGRPDTRQIPWGMAMTLRLNDSDDAALEALARAEGVSKQEAALRAIREKSARLSRDDEVRRMTDDIVERYGPLLDRLAE